MKTVRVVPQGEYSADIYLDGVKVGKGSDCDMGRWVVMCEGDADELLGGCYPADDAEGLAFAINECVAGVVVEGVM